MAWVHLHVYTDPDQAEALEGLLMELGASAVTLQDSEDEPMYEPAPGTTPLWRSTRVTGLFESGADVSGLQQLLRERFHEMTQSELGDVDVELVDDQDWERAWMEDFEPIRFGRRLWICPTWHETPEPGAVNLMLDPGLAFGTGTHPTTALCLQWLDGAELDGCEVIDYGCGSGVLAVAALLLGADHAMGTDVDDQALEASRENARRNQIADERFSLHQPEDLPETPADVLLANILAQPLDELAPILAHKVKPGGQIVLSGILSHQAEGLRNRYTQWFHMDEPVELDGWIRLTGTRHPA